MSLMPSMWREGHAPGYWRKLNRLGGYSHKPDCPDCGGTGESQSKHSFTGGYSHVPCWTCGGSGEQEEEPMKTETATGHPLGPDARHYVGLKQIIAWPQTKNDLPGAEPGYAVVYPDGYRSWSPKETFEAAYQPMRRMDYSAALFLIKAGKRLARKGWNGKGMFVFLVPGSTFKVNREPLLSILGEGTEVDYHGHIDMRTADGTIVPWVASQSDQLSNDWYLVEDAPQVRETHTGAESGVQIMAGLDPDVDPVTGETFEGSAAELRAMAQAEDAKRINPGDQ